MYRKFYLAARPETLVSLIINGTLPGNMPAYIKQDGLQLFETPQAAGENSSAIKKNTFILEYELAEDSSQYVIQHLPDKEITFVSTEKVDKTALKFIYVLNHTAQKLANNLLNSKSPVEIKIEPNFYLSLNLIAPHEPLVGEVVTPNQLVTYIKTGDLLASKMQTLVNTVNCVGVMGKGIALSFKQRFPDMFADYQNRCARKEVKLGKPYVYRSGDRLIVNFPTKDHWKNSSKLKAIEQGLQYLVKHANEWGIKSMAIPPLGCGNGGLDWDDVLPLINKYLAPLKMPLEIYEPFEKPTVKKRKSSAMETQLKQKPLTSLFQPIPQQDLTMEAKSSKKRKHNEEEKFDYKFDNKDTIQALLNGAEIGHLKVEFENGYYWLDRIEVNSTWRRKGVGTQLIREAINLFPYLQIPLISAKKGYDANDKYRLNEDVEKLVNHCLTLGVIKKEINCSQSSPKFSAESLRMV